MNARLLAASSVGGFALAALLFSSHISAQPAASAQRNGLFASLEVGQMVEFTTDVMGLVVRTWEDEEYKQVMKYKVKEIGSDFLVLEVDDKDVSTSIIEFRLPVYRFASVSHMGKSAKPASPAPIGTQPDKKAAPDKKPGMTKKKN